MAGYCQNSSCGTVNYRPYVGGKIGWRYGIEAYQEIIGADNYSLEMLYNLSANTGYKYVYQSAIVRNGLFQGWSSEYVASGTYSFNGIQDWYVSFDKTMRLGGANWHEYKTGYPPNDSFDYYYDGTFPSPGYRSILPTIWVLSQGSWVSHRLVEGVGIWIKRWQPASLNSFNTQCQFKVFRKEQIVYQETRFTCPQVQVIPCSLSTNTKAIAIKKLADLERIEINNTGIPAECLNVYTSGITTDFKAQICSSPGCPPPQYEVICCAPCESCPADTCAIECGDRICCYGADGISKQSIALANYCPS